MELLINLGKAFCIGGAICTVGQLLINYTNWTNGKILVIFLLAGAVLQAFGWYEKLVEFAGAGASVPISGFGSSLVKGAGTGMREEGWFGALKGGLAATAPGVSTAIVFGYLNALIFKPRTKKI